MRKRAKAALAAMMEKVRQGDRSSRFEVRRFAGPSQYADQFTRPLTIAHLTDQHVGRVTPMAAQLAAVDLVNAAEPDLVVITGDFVCHSLQFLDALVEVIGHIRAPVVGVLGNHDYWAGADEVAHMLRFAGMELLRNDNTTITLGHETLQIVGLDDAYTGHADRDRAVKGLRKDIPTLGLSHIAEEADGLWAAGVPLVLSGHTHAGQVTLASLHEMVLGKVIGHKYIHGLYGSRSQPQPRGAVYVGAGVGAAVMPLRVGERSRREVTIFELGARPGDFEEHHAEQQPHPGRKPSDKLRAARKQRVARGNARRARRNGAKIVG